MSSFKFGSSSLKRLSTVDERLQKIAHRALELSPIDFGIPNYGGLRTAEEQKALFDQKLSELDGYDNESYHQTGLALDVYAYVDGKASWDEKHLANIAWFMQKAANELGHDLEWGGTWTSFVDMPHFQLPRG